MNIYYKVLEVILLFIKKEYKSENLFLCISGLETEIVKQATDKMDWFKNVAPEYHVLPVYAEGYEFSFNEIVKARNDKKIAKIVILTNGSIKSIDSLKDFNQIDLKDVSFDKLWSIIKETYNGFKWIADKEIKKFVMNIVEIIKPELSVLFKYIYEVNSSYAVYNNISLSLNSNLFVLGIWSSAWGNILKKSHLRAIYNNSNPIQIQRKIKSARDIDLIRTEKLPKELNERYGSLQEQRKLLKAMFYNRTYNEAFEKVCYEYIGQIMKGGQKKKKEMIKRNENTPKYTNIYELAISELTYEDNISLEIDRLTQNESMELPDIIELKEKDEIVKSIEIPYRQNDEDKIKIVHIDFEKVKNQYRIFEEIFQNIKKSEELLKGLINHCQNLNLDGSTKSDLIEKLTAFYNGREAFLEDPTSPVRLNELLDKSSNYTNAFFDVIKYLFTLNQDYISVIAQSDIISDLLNVDVVQKNDELYVPYYNPIMIFHFHLMKNRLEEALNNINEMNIYKAKILEFENNGLLNDFIIYNKNLYSVSQEDNGFPYYSKYILNEKVDSIRKIDTNSLYQYLLLYIESFPYKNELRLCLIGDADINALKSTLTRLLKKAESLKVNLKSFKLRLLVKDKNRMKQNLLISLENGEMARNNLECQIDFLNESFEFNKYIKSIIEETDMIIFLDSRLMYLEPIFNEMPSDNMIISLKHRSFSNEINSFSYSNESKRVTMPLLPHAINTLQHSIISKELVFGVWDKYKLNPQIISKISNTIKSQNKDKYMLFLSSCTEVDEQLFDHENIINIDEGISEDISIKVIGWKRIASNQNKKIREDSGQVIDICAEELINSIYSYLPDDDSLKKCIGLMFTVRYSSFPEVGVCFGYHSIHNDESDNAEDNGSIDELLGSTVNEIYETFIKCAISPKSSLDHFFRENLINVLLKSSKSIEDIAFVYSLENIYGKGVNCTLDNAFSYNESYLNEEYIPSLDRNSIYSILKYIGAESMSQKRLSVLNRMVESANISRQQFEFLLECVKYREHENLKYFIENITYITERFEVRGNE